MRARRVTLKDVAELAGVHTATVSRALNAATSHLVSDETRERVERAAEKLSYTPDTIARSLRSNRTLTVGVVVPDVTNPTFGAFIRAAETTLRAAGFVSLLVNTDDDPSFSIEQTKALAARQVDGLIVASGRGNPGMFEAVSPAGMPLVFAFREPHEVAAWPTVCSDDAHGIDEAVRHLVELGHERIAYLGGPRETSTGRARHVAFLESVVRHGVRTHAEQVRFADHFRVEEGERIMRQLLEDTRDFTAVVAGNDRIALGAMAALRGAGLSCPDDVSIVGFNDMPFVEHIAPALTTVRVPSAEMGDSAARALLHLLEGDIEVPNAVHLTTLVVRDSTRSL